MSRVSTLAVLLEVAVGHHGFVTPESVSAAGVDPSRLPVMLSRGHLERWARGLYRIPQLPVDEHTELAAAVLRVGHNAVLSHRAALFLHGLAVDRPPTPDVTVPAPHRVRRSTLDGVTVHVAQLPPDDVAVVHGVRTTTIRRTIQDCHDADATPSALRHAAAGFERGLLDARDFSTPQTSFGGASSSGKNDRMERPRVEVIDGKALYDGRSLVSWAARVADRIVERCDATRVILYGSVARGDDGPDSDIDLLVVMPITGRRHDTSVRVLNELRDLPVPVDITVVDPARLHDEASVPGLVRVAVREGRVLVAA